MVVAMWENLLKAANWSKTLYSALKTLALPRNRITAGVFL